MNDGNQTPAVELAMWEAVQTQARRDRGSDAVAVVLVHDDGAVVLYRRGGHEELFTDTPGPFPAPSGWSFRGVNVAYNGRAFEVHGIRRRFLRVLAERPGEVVPDRAVKVAVWGDLGTEDNRLRDVAYQVRALLRAVFELPGECDPVERVEGGYRLAMPAGVAPRRPAG